MEISKATSEDILDITSLELECFKDPYKEKDVKYEIEENPFCKTLIAKIDGKTVGYLMYLITFDSSSIVRIGVKKEYRNQNIALTLLDESLKDLKENNVEFYTLEVREYNIPAIKLYEKFGFIKICTKNHYYDDGENAIYMMKGVI